MIPPRPLRIAIYARYSAEIQNPSSVDDQISLCRDLLTTQFRGQTDPVAALVFSDAAISGSTMQRPGIARLLQAAKQGRMDMVVSEALDRLSRSLKDIAGIFETLNYHGVGIWTAHEGHISELHIGLKGTMNALQLRDMKARVKRGHRARVAAGFAASSCAYGYRTVRGVVDDRGRYINGVREIDPEAAAVIQRVAEEYIAGRSIPDIVTGLNQDGIPAPRGGLWKRNALMGGAKKQEGILRNEIYTGKIIFNRSTTVRDPVTNRKRQIPTPESEWMKKEVPHLRILSEAQWAAIRAIDVPQVHEPRQPPKPRILTVHNQHALTGWVKCGWCGGPKSLANETRYLCSTHRYAHNCKNSRGTKEPVLMAAVYAALHDRIKTGPDFHPVLMRAFAKETRAREQLEKQEADIRARIGRLLGAIERGVNEQSATERILDLQRDLEEIRLKKQHDVPSALPDEALIRATLAQAVQSVEMSKAVESTRVLFQCVLKEIVLTPVQGQRTGETMSITLREAGWPDFWRTITEH